MRSWFEDRRGQATIAIGVLGLFCLTLAQFLQIRGWPPLWIGLSCLGVAISGFLLAREEARRGAGRTSAYADRATWVFWVFFAAVVALALALRLHTLMDRPAWDDEMWTLRNVYGGDLVSVIRIAVEDYWPPLHYLLLNAAARVGDTGLFTLRLPSVLFGVGTVALMPFLGREIFRSRKAGLVGGLFLAVMTAHVLYSQEARVYSMQVFWSCLSALFFFRSFWQGRVSILFIASTALLCYSHSFSTLYFLSSQWAYLLLVAVFLRPRGLFRSALISQVLVLVLVLPLLVLLFLVRFKGGLEVPTGWAGGISGGPILYSFVEQYQSLSVRSWASAIFQSGLFILAILGLWKGEQGEATIHDPGSAPRARFDLGLLFILCWVVAPVLSSSLVSLATPLKTFGAIRYQLTVLPGICLLAGAGFLLLRSRVVFTAGVVTILLIGAVELPRYYGEFNYGAYDEAAALVKLRRKPGEHILSGNSFRAFAYYFRGEYPRIGSAEWEEFQAKYAGLSDRTTDESGRFASLYSVEKLPEFIHWVRYRPPLLLPPRLRSYTDHLTRLKEEGSLEGPFWIVHAPPEKGIVDQLEMVDLHCGRSETWHFRGVDVCYCIPPPN